MKALLRYGPFTTFLDMPERKSEIRMMKPPNRLTANLPQSKKPTEPTLSKLTFIYKQMLAQDIAEYIFNEES